VIGTRTTRYRAVPPKIDCRWSISVVGGRLRKKLTVGGRFRSSTRPPTIIEGEKGKKKKRKRRRGDLEGERSRRHVSQNPELLKKLASLVEDGDDFDCPVCLSPPLKTVITCCAHIFCQACILKTLKHLHASCPICRHPLSKTDLFVVPPAKSSNDDGSKTCLSNRPLSSKVSFLLKLLLASKGQNPSTKSVIFSQFRKMLILLQEPLKDAGFVILRLDGTMSTKRRAEVIKRFEKCGPGEPTVLLASLKAAGTGINLTAASRVYLMEPWWNPAVEEQAMDRVHRIGQKEEVKVVRLIVRGSIEERILKLQERKKKLASGAFGRKAAKEQKQVRLEDLRIMMHL
ncbi:hypothetical protein BHM03_00040856, partial [Ensete ventricosum]